MHKSSFFYCLLFLCTTAYSQDSSRLKTIDSLVQFINTAPFKSEKDSIIRDLPEMDLYMRTYLTIIIDGKKIKKYVNHVFSSQGPTKAKKTEGWNIFYFHDGKLIKVEESMSTEGKELKAEWYYDNEMPIHYTFQSPKSADRAKQLVDMAKILEAEWKKGGYEL